MIIKSDRLCSMLPSFCDGGITVWPFIITTKDVDQHTINHELIHMKQQLECFWIGFFIIYIAHFLYNYYLSRKTETSYRCICFEREAYYNNSGWYLDVRKPYYWIRYLKRPYKWELANGKKN